MQRLDNSLMLAPKMLTLTRRRGLAAKETDQQKKVWAEEMGPQREEGVSLCHGRMARASTLLAALAQSVMRIYYFCNQTKTNLNKSDGSPTLKRLK